MGTKATFDTLFDNIAAILEAYSLAQTSTERFTVYPDRYRDLPANTDVAQVFLYLASITPTEKSATDYQQYDAVYWLDLVAKAKGMRTGAAYLDAGEAAGVRLRYLIKQVMEALFPAGNRRLNLATGSVSKKGFTLQTMIPESQTTERPMAAARMILTVGLAWEPTALIGTELDSIEVTADKWSALLEP